MERRLPRLQTDQALLGAKGGHSRVLDPQEVEDELRYVHKPVGRAQEERGSAEGVLSRELGQNLDRGALIHRNTPEETQHTDRNIDH